MKKEIWKDIPEYENLYQASNLGKIKSLKNNKSKKEKILKPGKDGYGYLRVVLFNKGNKKTLKVHRLIILTFKGNSNLEVNHKNGIKIDNELKNLEYCTKSDNIKHAYKNGLMNIYNRAKLVNQYTLNGNLIKTFKSVSDAGKFLSTSPQNISACARGEHKIAVGFIWRYEK